MRASKANLECADLILERNHLDPSAWPDLRHDIALSMDIAEREAVKKEGAIVTLKCWVGNLNGDYQGLVVATSKKKAAEIAGTSLYDFNQFWHKAVSAKIGEFKPDTLYRKKFDTRDPWEPKIEVK